MDVGQGGPGPPFVTLCAWLEEAGYRKEEIGRLTPWYVARVLQHRRDRDGRLVQNPKKTMAARRKALRRQLMRAGMTAEQATARVDELLGAEQRLPSQGQGRRRPTTLTKGSRPAGQHRPETGGQ